MKKSCKRLTIGGITVQPGKSQNIALTVSESYTGSPVSVHVRVIRAKKPGPTVFFTGAVHGDELNGVGVIRELMMNDLHLRQGTVILVPVANIFGFENHSRYLPDHRDLNRSFPGNKSGSLATRLAYIIFKEIVCNSDVGVDLHTAAVRRTNYPQVRADLRIPGMRAIAESFGCEVIINKGAHPGSLRSNASKKGCLTILYEAGEVLKFEPGTIQLGVRGALNVLIQQGMIEGELQKPVYQTIAQKTTWVRSDVGGLLHFHVRPGERVSEGQVLATAERLFSEESRTINAPFGGIVIGMTTLPAVKPGEPVCHIAVPAMSMSEIEKKVKSKKTLHRQIETQLGASFMKTKRTGIA